MKFRFFVLVLALTLTASAQKAPKPDKDLDSFKDPLEKEKSELGRPATYEAKDSVPAKPIPADLADIVRKQFGGNFEIFPGDSFQTGDLDGDGIEDAIIV